MEVAVTTGTGFLQTFKVEVFKRLALITGLMTIHALYLCMPALQVESSHVMFKGIKLPFRLRVTLSTIAASKPWRKILTVLILMTTQTFLSREGRPLIFDIILAFGNVTLRTHEVCVIADQGVSAFHFVIKFFNIFPGFGNVTRATFLAFELILKEVNIVLFMTSKTRVYLAPILRIGFAGLFIGSGFGVALHAVGFSVGAVEFETRATVIKVFRLEETDIGVSAFVILVAVDTILIIHQSVKMLLRCDVVTDFFVTFNTVLIGYPTSWFMAL